jgi:hypothetical protein
MGAHASDKALEPSLHLVAIQLGMEALAVIQLQLHLVVAAKGGEPAHGGLQGVIGWAIEQLQIMGPHKQRGRLAS